VSKIAGSENPPLIPGAKAEKMIVERDLVNTPMVGDMMR
jgi:hypothetical protein